VFEVSVVGVSLLALALSTLAYGMASYLQGLGVARAGGGRSPGVARTLRGLVSAPFVAGMGLDLVGVGLGSVALRELPLFLVQAAGVASVGVTALLAALAGQETDRLRLARGLLAGTAGCALLTLAAQPAPAQPLPGAAQLALGLGIPLAAVLALAAAGRTPRGGGLALTAVAGLAFAGVGLCLRGTAGASGGVTVSLGLACAVLLGACGTVLFAVALERTPVTVASGVLAFTELVVPAAVGLAVLGDRVRDGFLPVALAGCALVALALVELTAAETGGGEAEAEHPLDGGHEAADRAAGGGALPLTGPGPLARTVLPARHRPRVGRGAGRTARSA
jgi:hypothetical protein